MLSLISNGPLIEYGMQPSEPPCGSKYQCKSSSHHWAALQQDYKCSPDEWQHKRMVQNNSRSKARMSSVTHPLQQFSRTDRIESDALEENDGKFSIGDRNIINLRFADGMGALAEEEQELKTLIESLDKTARSIRWGSVTTRSNQ